MKRKLFALVALVLVAAMLFSGCGYLDRIIQELQYYTQINGDELEYTRPDLDVLQQALDTCCDLAQKDDFDALVDAINEFYTLYDDASTNWTLAELRYDHDLTDSYWAEEYDFCCKELAGIDGLDDQLLRTLAASPHRQTLEGEDYYGAGFFAAYDGESMWTEEFIALMDQEADLTGRYYELWEEASEIYSSERYYDRYWEPMTEVLIELVRVRQQQAAVAGYDSYAEFAYEYYYGRTIAPEAAVAYMEQVGETLIPLYRQTNESDVWDILYEYSFENENFTYGQQTADFVGGTVADAFDAMEQMQLYDIGYGDNKYDSAYQVWLPSYCVPYIFMSPAGDPSDQLTFVHELGHFTADYACVGSYCGMDVAEVHSQGLEYLSLCRPDIDAKLVRYKLADSLCTYVEQSAYALFEHKLYALEGDQLTAENVQAIYSQLGSDFGFDSWAWDERDYIAVDHFFTSPFYIFSYVVSNDVAFQLYQLELEQPGAGKEIYLQCLESQEQDIMRFASDYGFDDPLAADRLETVRQTFSEILY